MRIQKYAPMGHLSDKHIALCLQYVTALLTPHDNQASFPANIVPLLCLLVQCYEEAEVVCK